MPRVWAYFASFLVIILFFAGHAKIEAKPRFTVIQKQKSLYVQGPRGNSIQVYPPELKLLVIEKENVPACIRANVALQAPGCFQVEVETPFCRQVEVFSPLLCGKIPVIGFQCEKDNFVYPCKSCGKATGRTTIVVTTTSGSGINPLSEREVKSAFKPEEMGGSVNISGGGTTSTVCTFDPRAVGEFFDVYTTGGRLFEMSSSGCGVTPTTAAGATSWATLSAPAEMGGVASVFLDPGVTIEVNTPGHLVLKRDNGTDPCEKITITYDQPEARKMKITSATKAPC